MEHRELIKVEIIGKHLRPAVNATMIEAVASIHLIAEVLSKISGLSVERILDIAKGAPENEPKLQIYDKSKN